MVPISPTRNAASAQLCAACQSSSGTFSPRLDRNTPGSGLAASRTDGSVCTTAYQKNNCSSSGMSRITSTYTAATLASSQFLDSRAMPITVPRMVASTMPTTATFSVLMMPISSASP